MRKSRESTHSFFHDPDFERACLLLLTKLYGALNSAKLLESVLCYHTKWQPFFPSLCSQLTTNRAHRVLFRSMIWAAK